MQLFINDIPVNVAKSTSLVDPGAYDHIISKKGTIDSSMLKGIVLFKKASFDQATELIKIIEKHPFNQLTSVDLLTDDFTGMKAHIKSMYKIIRAAGGLVRKDEKVLMIYRLKKWDLPKGKIEKNENSKQAAVREVEEECNTPVKLDWKICSTWHTYTLNDKRILKKTNWYAMTIKKRAKIIPQVDEDIEEVRWMNGKAVYHALENTYKSIQYVFKRYYALNSAIDHMEENH